MFRTVYSWMFTFVTHVYSCLPMCTLVYLRLHLFTYVYPCLLFFTIVYLCLPLFTHHFYTWLLVFNCLHFFLPMHTPCILFFTYVTRVYLSLQVFTYVKYCLQVHIYLFLLLFTRFYLCLLVTQLVTRNGHSNSIESELDLHNLTAWNQSKNLKWQQLSEGPRFIVMFLINASKTVVKCSFPSSMTYD